MPTTARITGQIAIRLRIRPLLGLTIARGCESLRQAEDTSSTRNCPGSPRFPVPSGRGRHWRSGPPRPGTDRPAGHGKADASLTPAPGARSSRLSTWSARAAAMAAVVLSMVVRSEPHRATVKGILAGRPGGVSQAHHGAGGRNLAWRVRPVCRNHRVVGKPRMRRGSVFAPSWCGGLRRGRRGNPQGSGVLSG